MPVGFHSVGWRPPTLSKRKVENQPRQQTPRSRLSGVSEWTQSLPLCHCSFLHHGGPSITQFGDNVTLEAGSS